jgi:hypothetical protein
MLGIINKSNSYLLETFLNEELNHDSHFHDLLRDTCSRRDSWIMSNSSYRTHSNQTRQLGSCLILSDILAIMSSIFSVATHVFVSHVMMSFLLINFILSFKHFTSLSLFRTLSFADRLWVIPPIKPLESLSVSQVTQSNWLN